MNLENIKNHEWKSASNSSGNTILVVDDSSVVRKALEVELVNSGYEVITASSGTMALNTFKTARPDLILLDYHMPEMDGIDVLKLIRKDPDHKAVPVIMLTALADVENRKQAFAEGADDYIIKPYIKDELILRVKRLLESNSLNRELKAEVNKHKETALELSRKSSLNEILLDSLPNVAMLIRPETREVVASNAMAKSYGALPGQKCYAKQNEPCSWCKAPELWKTGKPQQCEIKESDSVYDIYWIPVSEDMYLYYALDITDRKRVEVELQEEKNKFQSIVEAMEDGLSVINPDYNLIYLSPDGIDLFGPRVGEKCYKVFEGKEGVCDGCPVEMAYEDGQSHTSIRTVTMSDGTTAYWENTANPIRDAEGNIVACLEIAKNITERRKMEEELQKAQKLESVGVLAGGIAHDFNNIITALWGSIQVARMDVESGSETDKLLEESEHACENAAQLTKQLLTFAKGGEPVKKVKDIAPIIKQAANFVLRGSSVLCKLDLPGGLWLAEIDQGQINQVIYNLLINALNAMPEGGKINISAKNVAIDQQNRTETPYCLEDGRYVEITVEDEGTGIPEELLSKIFDPYFTTKEEGTGLGLATCYSIINKHNGHIGVESELGKGTIFKIYLPASVEEAAPGAERSKAEAGHGRILLMDDEESVKKMASKLLSRLGYEVALSSNGEEAIEMYRKAQSIGRPYDCVILDLTIPGGMGGKKCFEKLLEIDPKIKVIISSGYSNDPIMSNYEEYGIKGVLPKPFHIEHAVDVLSRAISNN